MVNRFDPASAPSALSAADRRLLDRRRAVLGDIYPLFYDKPVHVVRGSGARLWDAEGNEYLDAYNNVPAVGHANPRVAEAVRRQLTQVNTHTRYLNESVVAYAERFLATHPAGLDRVVFTNSGSEANDLAVSIAQWRTGAQGVVVTRNAYHGTTRLLSGLSPENGPRMPLHPWVRVVDAPDTFRHGPRAGTVFAESVRAAAEDLRRHGLGFAALLVDTILSTDGIFPGEPGLLAEAFRATREEGGLVVADEVQPGLGRLGGTMWGFQRHSDGIDMATCGKPLAGGLPIGTLVLPEELSDGYAQEHRYFNTFGGNPASIAAATAVLDEIEDRNLLDNARRTGAQLLGRLTEIAAASPITADVRGAGLFIGVEMAATDGADGGRWARRMVGALRDRRVLISAVGHAGQVLKIRPPLVFDADDADEFTDVYAEVLAEVQNQGDTP
ncbi:aminotransferase class III-fold pyridoxal phosphate-dependent enzyme [Streptomyces paludis]|uniref:Aminotransferase class III-fold pyridoxal phosphate-dependent enzyme n=2 Tax=Streptomyces paludis TaxID=2282738 RepID=A0A345I2A1_9ACTN|nr:aminotransferase class III-fold pyridoxal phosphate-dependent enzyme [Streptomyces paludis]